MTSDHPVKFYGRRKGKTLRATRQKAIDTVLPRLRIILNDDKQQKMSPANLFPFTPKEIWLEIGFGSGEQILHLARNNPEIGFIGCEPFINGVAELCKNIKNNNIENIRIWPDDVRLLFPVLEGNCIDQCYLLNPDPWPKTRHHKRRFINANNLAEIHRVIKEDGKLMLSTDHPALAAWMMRHVFQCDGFRWLARSVSDWKNRPTHLCETRYQEKQLAGSETVFMDFQCVKPGGRQV